MRKVTVTFKSTSLTGTRLQVVKATNTLQWKPGEYFTVDEAQRILVNNPRIDFIFLKG